jgi:adenine nucleotide transporter 17
MRTEGLLGLYTGLAPALLLCIAPASQFFTYELCKQWLTRYRQWRLAQRSSPADSACAASAVAASLSSLDIFLLGALSKIVSTIISYPLQTLKTQLQKSDAQQGVGLRAVFADMIHQQGAASLYRGLNSKLTQTTLTAAFLFVMRDHFIRFFAALLFQKRKAEAVALAAATR